MIPNKLKPWLAWGVVLGGIAVLARAIVKQIPSNPPMPPPGVL